MVEQGTFNPRVVGSIPTWLTSLHKATRPHRLEAQDTALSRRLERWGTPSAPNRIINETSITTPKPSATGRRRARSSERSLVRVGVTVGVRPHAIRARPIPSSSSVFSGVGMGSGPGLRGLTLGASDRVAGRRAVPCLAARTPRTPRRTHAPKRVPALLGSFEGNLLVCRPPRSRKEHAHYATRVRNVRLHPSDALPPSQRSNVRKPAASSRKAPQ